MVLILSIDVGKINMGICLFNSVTIEHTKMVAIKLNFIEPSKSVHDIITNTLSDWIELCEYVVVENQCASKMAVIQHLIKFYCILHDKPCVFAHASNVKHFMGIYHQTGNHDLNKDLMIKAVDEIIRNNYPNLLSHFRNADIVKKNKRDDYSDAFAQAMYIYGKMKDISRDEMLKITHIEPLITNKFIRHLPAAQKSATRLPGHPEVTTPITLDSIGVMKTIRELRRSRFGLKRKSVDDGLTISDTSILTEEILGMPLKKQKTKINNNFDFDIARYEQNLQRSSLRRLERVNTMLEAGTSEPVIRNMINEEMLQKIKRQAFNPSCRFFDPRHPLTAQLYNDHMVNSVRVRRDQAVCIARHRLALIKILDDENSKTCHTIISLRKKAFQVHRNREIHIRKSLNLDPLIKSIVNFGEHLSNVEDITSILDKITLVVSKFHKKSDIFINKIKSLSNNVSDINKNIKSEWSQLDTIYKEIGCNLHVFSNQINYQDEIPKSINDKLPKHLYQSYINGLSKIEKESILDDVRIFSKPEYRWPLGTHGSNVLQLTKEPRILHVPYTGILFARHYANEEAFKYSHTHSRIVNPDLSVKEYNIGSKCINRPKEHDRYPKYTGKKIVGVSLNVLDKRREQDQDYFYDNEKKIEATHEEVYSIVSGKTFTDPVVDICAEKPNGHLDERYEPRETIKFA